MDREKKTERMRKVLPGMKKALEKCDICPRGCRVDRRKGEKGFCAAGADPIVYSYGPHHGEEPPLSGSRGSGTIFFSRCNMKCVYCQNNQFSQSGEGTVVPPRELGEIMLELQGMGCHNINLVTPTHFVPPIVEALTHACAKGLEIPVVYNTGGYDSPAVIKALDGIVDIYLPDMRYSSDEAAVKYSSAPGYVAINRTVVAEMQRQTGRLRLDTEGIGLRGLIIRLLILPQILSGTPETLEFIAKSIGKDTCLSVMSQYYPAYMTDKHPELSRRITRREYEEVTDKLDELGMDNGWLQPFTGDFDERFAGENFPPNV